MKKIRVCIFSVIIIALLSITVLADDSITSSNLFLFGEGATSKEKVIGDIYAFAKDIEVENSVNGDVISAGKDIDIKSDRILGNIRCLGQYIDIDVKNTKNITIAGQNIKIDEETVSNAVYVAGQNVEFNGTTNDLYVAGNDVVIDGIVNGNLDIRGKNVIIGENACVYGNIKIKSENEPIITGSVAWKDIEYDNINYKEAFEKSNIGIVSKLMSLISTIIISLIIFRIAKPYFLKLNKEVNTYIGKFILIGLMMFIIIPILILTLMLTIVGFPIGLMILGTYLSIIYLAPMYSGIIVGKKLLKNKNEYLQVIIGVTLMEILMILPYIRLIVELSCSMFMLGSLFINMKNYISKIR